MFLTVEGGDGAGKTTLIRHLKATLEAEGNTLVLTREPGGCPLAEHIREWVLNRHSSVSIGSRAEILLFLAARAQHIEEVIEPALNAGSIVICDRFHDSTIAYQGYGRGLGAEAVRSLCHKACGSFQPDLTLYLDVSPEVARKRISDDKREEDRMEAEKKEFHERVRSGYRAIAKEDPQRFILIDANASLEQVQEQALAHIRSRCLK